MEWTTSNVIAAGSLIVAILSAITAIAAIGANAWLGNRRMNHDRRMQQGRMAYERAEGVRTSAAEAYIETDGLMRLVNPVTIRMIAEEFDAGLGTEVSEALPKARDALGFVIALGWNDEVRDTARELLSAILKLASRGWAVASAIRNDTLDSGADSDFDQHWEKAQEALETYRKAVAGEE